MDEFRPIRSPSRIQLIFFFSLKFDPRLLIELIQNRIDINANIAKARFFFIAHFKPFFREESNSKIKLNLLR